MLTTLRLRLAAVALLAGSLLVHGWDMSLPGLVDRTGRLKCPDFLQFYTYGSLVRTGDTSALYEPEAHARVARAVVNPQLTLDLAHPNYSPVVAWLFAPLSHLPYLTAMSVWAMISIAIYAGAMMLLSGATGRVRHDPFTVALVAVASPALFTTLRYGQLSALSLAAWAICARLVWAGRPLLAGVALGALIYKPNLVIGAALALAIARQWRMLLGVIGGACLESALGMLLAGPDTYWRYLEVLSTIARQPTLVQLHPAESHSLAGMLRMWSAPPTATMLATLVGLVAAPWAGGLVWRLTEDYRPRLAALSLCAIVASPHLLTYDLLLLAVPIVLVTDWILEKTDAPPEGAWLATLLMLYFGAWPGTLIARAYGVQISTVGMVMGLWLLTRSLPRRRDASAGAVSMSPSMSS